MFFVGQQSPVRPSPERPQARGKAAAFFAGLRAMLRQRCPRCRKGKIFRGPFAMNDPCPECGLIFQREEGYFLGAMYVSYVLANAVVVPVFLTAQWLLPHWPPLALFGITMLVYAPLVPAVFRNSRVVWIHFERLACPGDVCATAFEKVRRQEFDRAARRAAEAQSRRREE